ncbi:polyketide synthesis protein [Lentisphaera araneosa HTCC2155]|uniref:Malonyl CoA-acyl carrier protein transacylase n=1 Tax=Lentisphaera araneosa HTCC2155 TaxID=313628 RepID=A6DK31_9BACT|nr:ACP S-malonyltransferase [Lentisphaera araneosa]EDM28255.1 polyketide synthesis protein [Lentisphaera araneosa HTCC2155]
MSTAYVFPGQGSQKKGMGAELFEKFPELVASADEVLACSIVELCTEDPREELNKTQFTQPALYVVNALTYLDKINSGEAAPAYLAGHSLGEYNALFAAGAYDFVTGLKLVQKRGEIMSKVEGGGMAAVLGMSAEQIAEVLSGNGAGAIDVANFNSPAQTVLSGMKDDIVAAEGAFKDAGAKRYVVLPVSGAFHSRYMEAPREEFRSFVNSFEFGKIKTPVISNFEADLYDSSRIADLLCSQIAGSVRWVESVNKMKDLGVEEFVECGPGRVLAGLIRQIG